MKFRHFGPPAKVFSTTPGKSTIGPSLETILSTPMCLFSRFV